MASMASRALIELLLDKKLPARSGDGHERGGAASLMMIYFAWPSLMGRAGLRPSV